MTFFNKRSFIEIGHQISLFFYPFFKNGFKFFYNSSYDFILFYLNQLFKAIT